MTHALKIWPEFFIAMQVGTKTFELRKDDRPFELGDTVLLQEYRHEDDRYTGNELTYTIQYILRDAPKFGLKPGYVILSLTPKITPKEKE